MGIIDTIENIRQKPEHIRLRYVWFFVSVSMFFVLTIWFFSVKTQMLQFNGASNGNVIKEDMSSALSEFSRQGESIKDAVDKTKNSLLDDANKSNQN